MLLGTLGAILMKNTLADKVINSAGKGRGISRAGEGVVKGGYGNKKN